MPWGRVRLGGMPYHDLAIGPRRLCDETLSRPVRDFRPFDRAFLRFCSIEAKAMDIVSRTPKPTVDDINLALMTFRPGGLWCIPYYGYRVMQVLYPETPNLSKLVSTRPPPAC